MSEPSSRRAWEWWPAALVAAGVLLVGACVCQMHTTLGLWSYSLMLAGVLILAGAWAWRRGTWPERAVAVWSELGEERARLEHERGQLEALQQELAAAWEQQTAALGQREQVLAGKLLSLQEWLEFPEAVDLSRPAMAEDTLCELAQQDRQLIHMLEQESQRLFDDILHNKYSPDGTFCWLLARDDAYDLIRRVAKIYRPEAEQPLLDTDLERIFRAASRACLQFLAILEGLPLNVPKHDLNSLYGYVRQGVKAYGMYKAVEPYWPYLSSAYALGRLALGANPVALGAWWFLRSMGTQGAKTLMLRVVHRRALTLLHNLVRVIGFEVASLYSTGFRYRDANWVYAAELTELASLFPLTREGLGQALRELGAVQLRNEYDRLYLYRCLAAQRSVQPERYRAAVVLTTDERQAVAKRLERFLQTVVEAPAANRVRRWQVAVEERLGVRLTLAEQPVTRSEVEQQVAALRSLAGFLLEIKQREPEELPGLLADTKLARAVGALRRDELWAGLRQDPPFFFQPPDIASTSIVAGTYLDDLTALAVRLPPHDLVTEEILGEVAGYLRNDRKSLQRRLQQAHVQRVAEVLPADAPLRRVSPETARAVLDLLEPDESPRFLYRGVRWPQATGPATRDCPPGATWLLGAGERLIAFTVADQPRLIWQGDRSVRATAVRGYVRRDCELTGGQWLVEEPSMPPVLRVAGARLAKYATYFAPLVAFCAAEPD